MTPPDWPGGSPPTTTHFAPPLAIGPGRSLNGEPPGSARFAPGEQPDSVLVAASLAASGWPVIPLRRHTRTPIGASGPRHCLLWHLSPEAVAATDEERIGLGTSWGVVLGEPNADGLRLVVLDTDTDAAEADLLDLFDSLGDEGRDWAAGTFTVRTSRGVHRYGVTREPLTTARHDDRPGLDLKGAGGYVVVPGCWHPSGTLYAAEIGPGTVVEFTGGHHPDGSVYLGLCDPDDDGPAVAWAYPLPLPSGLLDALDWPREDDESHGTTEPAHPTDESPSSSRRLTLGAAERRLEGLARSITNAPEGQGNACLNWAAGVAAAVCASTPDAVDPDDVRAALVAAYLARPIPRGESATSREREARATVASGWRWGSAHPAEALTDRHHGHRENERDDETNGDDPVTLHVVETPQAETGTDETAPEPLPGTLAAARARFHLLDRDALDALPEPVELVAGVLPALGALVVLTGSRGRGKSLLTLSLSGALSCGLSHWYGPGHTVTSHGPVLYVAREGFHGVPRRVRAWEDEHGHRLDGVSWLPSPVDLKNAAHARDLALIAADLGAVMVVTDSARATGAGKEDTDDMGQYVKGLERVATGSGALVLTLHNTGWDDTRGRGSTLLPDAADTVLHLDGKPDPGAARTLTHHKHRDGDMLDAPGLRFRFRKVEGTGSGVLVPTDDGAVTRQRREDNRAAVESARLSVLMTRVCEVLTPSRLDSSRAMSGRKVGDHLRGSGHKHSATDVRAALAALESGGHITTSPHRLVKPFYFVTFDGSEGPK